MADGSSRTSSPERSLSPSIDDYMTVKQVVKTAKVYQCKRCGYHANWPSLVRRHIKTHSPEKPFGCPHCSYRSKRKYDVVRHLKRCGSGGTVHDVIDKTKANAGSSEKPDPGRRLRQNNGDENLPYEVVQKWIWMYKCSLCDYCDKEKYPFIRHMKAHSSEKPHGCPKCSFKTKWKWNIKAHLKTCASARPSSSVSPDGNEVQAPPQAASSPPDSENPSIQASPQMALEAASSPAAASVTQDTGSSASTTRLTTPAPSPIAEVPAQQVQALGSSMLPNPAKEEEIGLDLSKK